MATQSSNIQGCNRLNPWHYDITSKNRAIALVTLALAAIIAATGFLAILASNGLSIGALNALSNLTVGGGGALTVFGGITFVYTVLWLICKTYQAGKSVTRQSSSQPKPGVNTTPPKEDVKPKKDLVTDETVILSLKQAVAENKDLSVALKEIPPSFFEDKSQERAKTFFKKVMESVLETSVSYPKPIHITDPESLTGTLDTDVFSTVSTHGVEKDIPEASKSSTTEHVFQVASQYNAAEAPSRYTPPIGEAMIKSKHDHTQGPLAQHTNPAAFEFVTAFLTHLGFNMLEKVIPSAGTTYDSKSLIKHGYLCPKDEDVEQLTEEFKANYAHAEYVCYESHSKDWGPSTHPVHIFLQAAPAIGYSYGLKASTDDLQKYASFTNYLAFFQYGIELAQKTKKPVVLHATYVGGGVFGNKLENISWGYEKAGLALQHALKANGVTVQFKLF